MADPENFQHYQVLKRADGTLWELGRGAMGVTYKAFDTSLRCNVALKVINAAYLDSDMAQQRFLREARAAAGLSHPNVASVFHLGESGGNYFYAMEFIDGETLEAFVRRHGPLAPLLALRIALQVARALRAASREGLVHRDIKPANLMLLREEDEDEIHVKVIDFGLAKVAPKDGEASATITVAGFVGTPHFASPEQLEEKDLDVRSDMYSLGVSLWYMLTGKPPFGGTVVQIMSQHLTRKPPFQQMAGMPPEVVHLLEHLLEKDAAKRPQTASDLRREIEHVMHALQASGAAAPAATVAGPFSAAAQGQVDTSFPTEAITEEGLGKNDTSQAPIGEPASGTVLAKKYRLLHEAAHSEDGSLFQAMELDTGRAVAVKILAPDSLAAPELLRQAQEEVSKARGVVHPALLRIYALEREGAHPFLTFEWVNAITVLDLLRHRHALTVPEALQILEPIAGAADQARAAGLPELDVGPAHILLAFDAALDLPSRTSLLPVPLGTWPPFGPKVLPLNLRSEMASSVTWAGQQTIVPVAKVAPGILRQLALLTYEMLGGRPAAIANAAGAAQQAPLPALSEEGNTVLRNALQTGQPAVYDSAGAFATALRASLTAKPVDFPNRAAAATIGRVSGPPALPAAAATPPPALPQSLPFAQAASLPEASALAVPSALPPVPPRPGATAKSVATAGGKPSRGPLVTFIVLLILFVFLGLLAGLGFATWKFLLPQVKERLASWQTAIAPGPGTPAEPTPAVVQRALPVETATAAPALPPVAPPVPFPTAAMIAPTPTVAVVIPPSTPTVASPTPAPAPDRGARFQELLTKSQDLDRAGDVAGALDGYVTLAQDYPEQDKGLSRVDSFVGAIRAAPLAPDLEQGRAQKLREPMERAAGLGSQLAMLFLGDHLLATDPATAAGWYQKAADLGAPEAMFALGNLYFKGVGVPEEPERASQWFRLASDKGFVRAKIYLAECYEEGKGGVPRNFDRAFALLNEALVLEPNNAVAMEKLGVDYERGRGTSVDVRKAFALTQRAAVELHDANALANLGVYYMNGSGGPKDPKKAAALFKEGAEKQNAACMFFYAQCLYDGVGGTPVNHAEATSYFRASAERGFRLAQAWCQQNRVTFAGGE